ncbi:MAG TPA: cation:proton antiporter, partial [Solirubrobacteraceae bacterium]|nr:cation:proton antiporter [Solirubrobacteraceae bacterium]
GIAHDGTVVTALSDMGLTTLIFLAGYELDLVRVRGLPLGLAAAGWLISAVLALAVALALVQVGIAPGPVVVAMALTTTTLGTLLPVLRDEGLIDVAFGTWMLAIGTVGEFGPIVAVAIVLDGRDPTQTALLLGLFLVIAVGAGVLAVQSRVPKVIALMQRHLQSSAQLPIRSAVLLLIALVFLASFFGLDVLLGAFAAGIVMRLFVTGPESAVVKGKLEAIGFGLLVPVFFVVSGMQFNLRDLISTPDAFLRLPLFLVAILLVRGLPALLLYRGRVARRELLPLALFSATGLPLIVVITAIGVAEGRMAPENATALVGAGMLSVLLYPAIGKALLRFREPAGPLAGVAAGPAGGGGEPPPTAPVEAPARARPHARVPDPRQDQVIDN